MNHIDKNLKNIAKVIHRAEISYTPLISLIMPVYNAALYLRESLNSILFQSLSDVEIICIDDGSTDDSLNILKEYAEKDARITLMLQNHLSAGAARNAGISVASGEYLWFVDADDLILDDAFSKLSECIKEIPDIDIVLFYAQHYGSSTDHAIVGTSKKEIVSKIPFSPRQYPLDIFTLTNPAPWTKLFRASFIREKNIRFQNLTSCNDVFFVTTSLALAGRIVHLDEICYYYRVNAESSISSQRGNKNVDNIIKALVGLKSVLNENQVFHLYKQSFFKFASNGVRHVAVRCDNRKKLIVFKQLKTIIHSAEYKKMQRQHGVFLYVFGLVAKIKSREGRRRVYVFGIKIASYKRKPSLKTEVRGLSSCIDASNRNIRKLINDNQELIDLLEKSKDHVESRVSDQC